MWYNFNDNDNNYRRNNSGMIHKNEPKFKYWGGIAMKLMLTYFGLLNEDNASLAESILAPQITIENIISHTQAEDFNAMKQNSWISRMLDENRVIVNVNLKKKLLIKKKKKRMTQNQKYE